MKADGIITVGRGNHMDIQIFDDTVSTEHMTMLIAGDKIEICDCNSTNGVFVKHIGRKKIIRQVVAIDTELMLGNYCTTPRKLMAMYKEKQPTPQKQQDDQEPFSRYLRSDNGTFQRR